MYNFIEEQQRECLTCKRVYARRKGSSAKQWEASRYCGRKCHHIGLKCSDTYGAIHNWLAYHHKKTGICFFCDSVGRATERALIKGKEHARNIFHYHELCVSCHRLYDFTEETRAKLSKAKKGKPRAKRVTH